MNAQQRKQRNGVPVQFCSGDGDENKIGNRNDKCIYREPFDFFIPEKYATYNRYPIASLLIVCLVFIYPYQEIGRKVYHPEEYSWDKMYPISEFLQDAFHGRSSMDKYVIAYKDFDQHLKVYTDALKDKKQDIRFKQPDQLSAGDTVIASEEAVYKTIESRYAYQLLKDEREVKVYLINGLR